MNRPKKRIRLLSVLLIMALMATSFGCGTMGVVAAQLELDIGESSGSVTAVLEDDGTLTIRGAGEIRDFTEDTAPFANWNVTAVEIGGGITGIGAYAFYNCGGITETLVLPKGLVSIGDFAFSGRDEDTAPKPEFVINEFTEAQVAERKEQTTLSSAPEETAPESEAEPQEAAQTGLSVAEVLAEDAPDETEEADDEEEALVSSTVEEEPTPTETPQPTPTPQPDAESGVEEDTEPSYTIKKLTEQEIGTEIFYPHAGAFVCSDDNQSFAAAMQSVGYTRADRAADVVFHCGEGSSSAGDVTLRLPVVKGTLVLPALPAEFSAPEEGELCSYEFAGWTEQKDSAGTVREAGSSFSAGDRTDLYFIAGWTKKVKIKIAFIRTGEVATYTVPDISGYDVLSYQWQTALGGAAWENLPAQTAQTCTYTLQAGDSKRQFRCILTVKKQQNAVVSLFAESKAEQLELEPIASGLTEPEMTLSLAKGNGIREVTAVLTLPTAGENHNYRVTEVNLPDALTFVEQESDLKADGKSFFLALQPTGDRWIGDTARMQLVSSTENDTWKSGVPHLLCDDGYAITGTDSTVELLVTLRYDSGYSTLTDDVIQLTLEEDDGTHAYNRVKASFSIEDITFVKQTTAVDAGRVFAQLTDLTAEIAPDGAVSAQFITEFYPTESDAQNTKLVLYRGETAVSLPKGTQIILADRSDEKSYSYYSHDLDAAAAALSLKKLEYPGTKKTNERVKEHLLVVLDFHKVAKADQLAAGIYSLRVDHAMQTGAENPKTGARFTVVKSDDTDTDTLALAYSEADSAQNKWAIRVDSSCENAWFSVTLHDSEGTEIPFPQKTVVSGAVSSRLEEDGSLQLAAKNGLITVDVSGALDGALAEGDYTLKFRQGELPGLQNHGKTELTAQATVTVPYVKPTGDASTAVRSLSVDAATRILYTAEGDAEWKLYLGYGGTEERDQMRVTVLHKIGTDPGEKNYTAEPSVPGYLGEPANELTLTIPQGLESGTYRALVEILDENGAVQAKEPFNFIVVSAESE